MFLSLSEHNFFFNAPLIVKAGMDMGKIHQKMNEQCLIECLSNIWLQKKKYELCKIPVIEYALFAVLSRPQKFDYLKNMCKNIPTLNNFVNQKLQKNPTYVFWDWQNLGNW